MSFDPSRLAEILATIFTVLAAVWKISKMTGKLETSIEGLTKVVEKIGNAQEKQRDDQAGLTTRVTVIESHLGFASPGRPGDLPYRIAGFSPREGEQ